jgi:hypothetical protein
VCSVVSEWGKRISDRCSVGMMMGRVQVGGLMSLWGCGCLVVRGHDKSEIEFTSVVLVGQVLCGGCLFWQVGE